MEEKFDLGMKVLGVVILIAVVLFILTWTGVMECKDIHPYWCSAYDAVIGSPRVLIVYGDSGMGDPDKLKVLLQDARYVGVGAVDAQHVDRITIGNLKKYKLVIVEHARKLSADQLLMFEDYVNKNGGRLVWIGDSGVEFGEGEVRDYSDSICERNSIGVRTVPADDFGTVREDINCSDTAPKIADNPWFRIKDTPTSYDLVNFDEFLGLKYVDNYCNQVTCPETPFSVGALEAEVTGEHPLIYGTAPALNFRITKERDFAIVKPISDSSVGNIVLNLNHGGVGNGKTVQIPKNIPIIATSSIGLGERVAYYAYPPEWFYHDNNYFQYVKRMYFGMMGR